MTEEAVGDLLKLVCADDLLHPTNLSKQVAALDAAPSAVMVACRRDIVDARGVPILRGRGLRGLDGLVPGADAVRRGVRAGSNIFGEPVCVTVRRDVLRRVGGWDGDHAYLIDQATYARVLRNGDLVAQPEVLAAFRISAEQWSVALARDQARQAADFHRSLRASDGGVSDVDVRIGNARATLTAGMRRALYLRLGRRLRPARR